ncbi:hypothetical protein GWK47_047020 [Chionoecetes opilio]|uniref:Uncharacterized protein n=1 Tax=Chionoecetes opilio TaxID=41210 RepID=A0A8J4Y5N1_CHIOP|nr:hypothetical protein GWK47_047020 [Chionoecetes opilio]
MGGWLRRSCWCPTFPLPRPGPSHGPGRGVERSLAHVDPPPLPRPSTYLGVGGVWRCRWGFWGLFLCCASPFSPHCFTLLFPADQLWAQGCSVSFRSRGHSSAPRTPRAFCRTFFVPPIARVCCGWLRLILPEGVSLLYWRGLCDLKEWRSKALKSRQRSHFRLSGADRSLGSRLGLAKSSISSSSRTSRPPASASMSSASIVLTVEQDLAVSSVPHHDRDSRSRTCRLVCGSYGWSGVSWAFPKPSPPVPPGFCRLGCLQ